MLYTGLVLYCWSNSVKSQAGLGLSGVFLVIITVAGGLGASALIGIPFNPSTTQILPFIALGTGVNAMFIMTQTYSELLQSAILPEEVSCLYLLLFSCMRACVTVFPILAYFFILCHLTVKTLNLMSMLVAFWIFLNDRIPLIYICISNKFHSFIRFHMWYHVIFVIYSENLWRLYLLY